VRTQGNACLRVARSLTPCALQQTSCAVHARVNASNTGPQPNSSNVLNFE